MANSTILQKIQENENDCLHNPSLLSEYLVIITSNLLKAEMSKLNAEIEKTKKWIEIRQIKDTDKQADEAVKLTDEYRVYKEAEAISKVVLETIRSVKKRLAFLATEYQELQN